MLDSKFPAFAALAIGVLLITSTAWAQQGGSKASTMSPAPAPATGLGSVPDAYPKDAPRAVFLSGKVVLEDGAPPPERAVIQRVCGGVVRPEGYTDSKGDFSIQFGSGAMVSTDSSIGVANEMGGFGMSSGITSGVNSQQVNEQDIKQCEIIAVLAGYVSDRANLAGRRSGDKSDLGTLVLHRMGGVEGSMGSITIKGAPKDAVKAFENGHQLALKQKPADARKEFEKAVKIYPQYVSAWVELGKCLELLKDDAGARNAYEHAVAADLKYLPPYIQLVGLAIRTGDWKAVSETTDRLLKLDPLNFPSMYVYSAMAQLTLQNLDAAEKSAREAVKLDTKHQMPQANQVLAAVLAQRGDNAGAAENLRIYLQYAPNGVDAPRVKAQLAKLEQSAPAAPPVGR